MVDGRCLGWYMVDVWIKEVAAELNSDISVLSNLRPSSKFGNLLKILAFLGSMLPQYMALYISFCLFVCLFCVSKFFLDHF